MALADDIKAFEAIAELPRGRKALVFYSEGPAYWPHLKGIVRELVTVQRCPLLYVTSSPEDPGLKIRDPLVRSFNIGSGGFRKNFFKEIEADIMALTMPDLAQLSLPRSAGCGHYAYLFHSPVSTHMIYREGAFDHYDTIFCVGPHHEAEIRRREEMTGITAKRLFPHGYSRLDELLAEDARRQAAAAKDDGPAQVLVAPSWGPSGLLETVGAEMVGALLEAGYRVVVRPHPQTMRLSRARIDELSSRFADQPLFVLETDMSSKASFFDSDVVVSDWSGAALEYAFARLRPVVFVDTPRKVNNPNWQSLGIAPLEDSIRSEIGVVVPADQPSELASAVASVIADAQTYSDRIRAFRRSSIFNEGASDAVAARELARMTFDVSLGDEGEPEGVESRAAAFANSALDSGDDTGSLRAFLKEIVGEATLDAAALRRLEALCRRVDVQKRLHADYDPDFRKPTPQSAAADPNAMPALICALLRAAQDCGERGLSLKFLGSADNALGLYAAAGGVRGIAALESLIARTSDRVLGEAA